MYRQITGLSASITTNGSTAFARAADYRTATATVPAFDYTAYSTWTAVESSRTFAGATLSHDIAIFADKVSASIAFGASFEDATPMAFRTFDLTF